MISSEKGKSKSLTISIFILTAIYRDLLPEIKRKGSDFITFLTKPRPQFEEPIAVDNMSIMQENNTLKQVQRTMSEKIQTLEKKLADTTKINELLLIQIQM